MIELLRYARLKPYDVVSTKALNAEVLEVSFKRFRVDIPGVEETPEISEVSFSELEKKHAELVIEMEVVKELLALKPR